MPTLNFSNSDDYIIPSNKSFTYRGLGGNDTYIISENTIINNAKISIVDSEGSNIIQLVNGLVIDSNLFTKNAMRLYLSNGSQITISGADKFTYHVGGNATTGSNGTIKTFAELAELFGLDKIPTSGSKKGTANIIIKNNTTSSSLVGTEDDDSITLTGGNDNFTITAGEDTIDGGAGTDTLIVAEGSRVVPANDETGTYTGTVGKDFVWIQLSDSSTETGFSTKKTIATNFENIQISDDNSLTSIKNYIGTQKFTLVNVQLNDLTIADDDVKSYDMSPYFASNNYNYVRNYTISSDAGTEISDQISLVTTTLDTTPYIKLNYGGSDKEYRLYKNPLTWSEAKTVSESLSTNNTAYSKSNLVIINSKDEADGLWNEIKTILNGMNAPKASDGGNSSYLWLGASDSETEGNWVWTDGRSFGSLEEDYWGSGSLGNEPDNYNNQDALALGLENWPSGSETDAGYGNAGSWNDIDSGNKMWYLVELDKTGNSTDPLLRLTGGNGGPTYEANITITAKENLLDTSGRSGEASMTFKVIMSDDDYDPDVPLITKQTADETSITVSEEIGNLKLLDLSFLNADSNSVEFYRYGWGDEDNYGALDSYGLNIFEQKFSLTDNAISFQPKTYLDYETNNLWYQYINEEEDINSKYYHTAENLEVRIKYTSNGATKYHKIKITVANIEETTTVTNVKEYLEGITLLDLTSFKIDEGTTPEFINYSYIFDGETRGPYTYNDAKYNFLDIDTKSLKLAPKSYLVADNYRFYYEYTPDEGDSKLSYVGSEDFTIRFNYISNGNTKNHTVIIGSVANSETTTIQNIEEDTPNLTLLDLTSFKIDEGTTPEFINYSYKLDGETQGPYTYDDDIDNLFDIDTKSLKLAPKSYLDADQNRFFYEYTPDEGDSGIYSREAKNFTVTIKYISGGTENILKVVIGSIKDNLYGFEGRSDNNNFEYTDDLRSDNIEINSLVGRKKYVKSIESDELEILYSFVLEDDTYGDTEAEGVWFQSTDDRDTINPATDTFKAVTREILEYIESIINIKFTEVESEDYTSGLRFALWQSSEEIDSNGYAQGPYDKPSYIFMNNTNNKWDDPNNSKKYTYDYGSLLHEIGHALNLNHPQDGGGDYFSVKADIGNNTSLFTTMAYQSAWLRETDTYNVSDEDGELKIVTSVRSVSSREVVRTYTFQHNDLKALEFMYGLRDTYKSGDDIYSFLPSERINFTLHDMGGNDTIDLSNYSVKTSIDLRQKGVNEIGENKLVWGADDQTTGDVFVIGPKTTIEIFIGSSGDNNITLDQNVIQTVTTSDGSDIIKNALVTDTISAGSGSDDVYVTINSLNEINSSINIDGGSGSSFFARYSDTLHINMPNTSSVDLSIFRLNFDNFEIYDFSDSFSQNITIGETDFVSIVNDTLKIKGDSDDKVILPENSSQTRADEDYVYYAINNIEIAISDDMLIG